MDNHHPRAFQGGSQPVRERPPERAGSGRTVFQAAIAVVAAMTLIAAILWVAVPFAGR